MSARVRTRIGAAALASALGLLAAAAACNGVLGIDTATLDPTFGQDAGGIPDTPCGNYCTTVLASCPNAEYDNAATCLALCAAFDPGEPTDTTQDSLGCRQHYATLAASDPSNCRAAGPLGGGVCGNDLCATFCSLDTFECTGQNAQFDGGGIGCEDSCAANFDTYLTDAGNDLALSAGNTLNCRIWHLEAAVNPSEGAGALSTHCGHTTFPSALCR